MGKFIKEYSAVAVAVIVSIFILIAATNASKSVSNVSEKQTAALENNAAAWQVGDSADFETVGELTDVEQTQLDAMQAKLDAMQEQIDNFEGFDLDKAYPIGSIYITMSSADPADLMGGTWERMEDRELIGAGNLYTVGSEQGSSSVKLAATQIPSLSVSGSTNSAGAHTHVIGMGPAKWNYGSQAWYSDTVGPPNQLFAPYGYGMGSGGPTTHAGYYNQSNGTSTYSSGTHTHTVTAKYTNNNQTSVSVMDPTIAVYMWKRVA